VIVRSSANVEAGAQTRLSAVFHGVWLLGLVLAFPQLLAMIPRASLAAILVYTGYKLVNPKYIKRLWLYGKMPVVIYFVTLVAIVATDLLTGVIIGVALSFLNLLWAFTHLDIRTTVNEAARRADMILVGSATFLRLPKLVTALELVPPGMELHIHLQKLRYIDHACMEVLANWEEQRKLTGNTLVMERAELIDRSWQPVKAAEIDPAEAISVPQPAEPVGAASK
jgi:MFS superfamily sulfate permease-like transporter